MTPFALAALAALCPIVLGIAWADSARKSRMTPAERDALARRVEAARIVGSSGTRRRSFVSRIYSLQDSGVSSARALMVHAGVYVISGAFCTVVLGWPFVGLTAAGLFGYLTAREYAAIKRDKRRRELDEALGDAISGLRDLVRGGSTLERAFTQMSESGPLSLRSEFAEITGDFTEFTFEIALARAQERIRHPVFDSLAVACTYSFRAGGENITMIMDRLAVGARGRIAIRREARARQTEGIWTGRILSIMPPTMLAVLGRTNPDMLAPYQELTGQVVLSIVAVLVGVGYVWMMRISALPPEPRVLFPTIDTGDQQLAE